MSQETATPERDRKAHAGSVDQVELENEVGRKVAVAAKKYLSVLEVLHSRGKIDDRQAAAGWTYYLNWYKGTQPSSAVPRYDEPIAAANQGDEHMDAAEIRAHHHHKYIRASEMLGPELTPFTDCLILEHCFAGEVSPPGLLEVGRRFSGYKSKDSAIAFAFSKIETALDKLVRFYSI